MNTDNFCHWLDGLFTLSKKQTLNKQDVSLIKEHLDLVLKPKTLQSIGGNTVLKTNGDGIVTLNSPTFICNVSAPDDKKLYC